MKLDKNSKDVQLMSSVYNCLKATRDDKLEIKPQEFDNDNDDTMSMTEDLEKIEKYKNSILMNENKIICDNIIVSFFELEDEKFLACIDKILSWGFELCFREYILNYYLYIKKSNRLRQYIIMNIDSIIAMLKRRLEIDLLENLSGFNFNTYKTHEEIEFLKNDLRNKEAAMLAIKAKNFNEFAPVSDKRKEILDNGQRKNLRAEVLNRLKYENPKLEEDF